MLLEKGVAVNERLVMYEKSALSHAVDHGRLAMAQLLFENGVDVGIRRDNRCARGKESLVLARLLQEGAVI